MRPVLTIAIPTFNRATRLDKSLTDLLEVINCSGIKAEMLSVFVSNNGSTDHTQEVIEKYRQAFSARNINFDDFSFSENQGFDKNILNCYVMAKGQFVMFLSDDDNLYENFLPVVLDDIESRHPNIIVYNFNQAPYTKNNPHIVKDEFFDKNTSIASLVRVVHWPKLTSIILKTNLNYDDSQAASELGYGFMHTALVMDIFLEYGGMLHSPAFIGYPDEDYLDHVDFPPYVGDFLVDTVFFILQQKNLAGQAQYFKLKRSDRLDKSLQYLAGSYGGDFKINLDIKKNLYMEIRKEFALSRLKDRKFKLPMKPIFIFIFNYLFRSYSRAILSRIRTAVLNKKSF